MAHEYCENCKKAVDVMTFEAVAGRTAAGSDVHFCSMNCCRNYQRKHGDVEVTKRPGPSPDTAHVSAATVGRRRSGMLGKLVLLLVLAAVAAAVYFAFFAKKGKLGDTIDDIKKKVEESVE
jgi:hypothetical protein